MASAREVLVDNMKTAVDKARKGKGRGWSDLVELNAWLANRCRELWSEIQHPEHNQFNVAEMLELECEQMMDHAT